MIARGECVADESKRRGDWTRTSGLLLPKQVRYQLRYTPFAGA